MIVNITPNINYAFEGPVITFTVKWSSVAAQGNDNPIAIFGDHALVQKGTQIYDPSYGTGPFTGILDWENKSVDGYGVQFYKYPSMLSTNFLFWIGHKDIEDTQEVEEYEN